MSFACRPTTHITPTQCSPAGVISSNRLVVILSLLFRDETHSRVRTHLFVIQQQRCAFSEQWDGIEINRTLHAFGTQSGGK